MTRNEEKIIAYVDKHNLAGKSRLTGKVEQRYYIAGYLYYKYGWTEEELADLFNKDHSSINRMKVKPYEMFEINDEVFLSNTKYLRKEFPYTFPKPERYQSALRHGSKRVTLKLSRDQAKKLDKYAQTLTIKSSANAIRTLIDTFL